MWPFARRKRPQAQLKTAIGLFTFFDTGWVNDPADGEPLLTFPTVQLDLADIERARQIMQSIDALAAAALDYARREGKGLVTPDMRLVLEHVDFHNLAGDELSLEFEVENYPDMPELMITVDFCNGQPVDVWGSD